MSTLKVNTIEPFSGTSLAVGALTSTGTHGALPDFIFNNGIYTTTLGLMPTWNANFGAAVASATGPYAGSADVLTPCERMVRLALALRGIANQTEVVSATANGFLKPSCSDTPICLDVLGITIKGLLPALYTTPEGPNVQVYTCTPECAPKFLCKIAIDLPTLAE